MNNTVTSRYRNYRMTEMRESEGPTLSVDSSLSSGQCTHMIVWKSGSYSNGAVRYRCPICGEYMSDGSYIPAIRMKRMPLVAGYYKRGVSVMDAAQELGWSPSTVNSYYRLFRESGYVVKLKKTEKGNGKCSRCRLRERKPGGRCCQSCTDYQNSRYDRQAMAEWQRKRRAKIKEKEAADREGERGRLKRTVPARPLPYPNTYQYNTGQQQVSSGSLQNDSSQVS